MTYRLRNFIRGAFICGSWAWLSCPAMGQVPHRSADAVAYSFGAARLCIPSSYLLRTPDASFTAGEDVSVTLGVAYPGFGPLNAATKEALSSMKSAYVHVSPTPMVVTIEVDRGEVGFWPFLTRDFQRQRMKETEDVLKSVVLRNFLVETVGQRQLPACWAQEGVSMQQKLLKCGAMERDLISKHASAYEGPYPMFVVSPSGPKGVEAWVPKDFPPDELGRENRSARVVYLGTDRKDPGYVDCTAWEDMAYDPYRSSRNICDQHFSWREGNARVSVRYGRHNVEHWASVQSGVRGLLRNMETAACGR